MGVSERSKVADTILVNELRRIRGYHGFPEMADELLRVLQAEASSAEHSARIVTEVIESWHASDGFLRCPSACEFRAIARCVSAETLPRLQAPNPTCRGCGGSGFLITSVGGLSGAAPCECRRSSRP
jgi:hypothetical protein